MVVIAVVALFCGWLQLNDRMRSLRSAARGANRIVIEPHGTRGRTGGERVELLGANYVSELLDTIDVARFGSATYCECLGQESYHLYDGDRLILTLVNHHGVAIDWPSGRWREFGRLTEPSRAALPRWLAVNGYKSVIP